MKRAIGRCVGRLTKTQRYGRRFPARPQPLDKTAPTEAAAPWGRLRIYMVDDEIVVTLPGTSYSVTYYKLPNSPQLLARRVANEDDPRVPMTLSEFLARAWRIANDKARELGWIA